MTFRKLILLSPYWIFRREKLKGHLVPCMLVLPNIAKRMQRRWVLEFACLDARKPQCSRKVGDIESIATCNRMLRQCARKRDS